MTTRCDLWPINYYYCDHCRVYKQIYHLPGVSRFACVYCWKRLSPVILHESTCEQSEIDESSLAE